MLPLATTDHWPPVSVSSRVLPTTLMSMTSSHDLFARMGRLRMPQLDSLQRFLGYTTQPLLSPNVDTILSTDLDLVFPPAKPITRDIEALGLDSATATTFSDAYLSAASSLRERCKYFVRQSTASIQSSTPDNTSKHAYSIRKRYSMIYHHFLATWKKSTIEQSRPISRSRHGFNRVIDSLGLILSVV